jgi:glycosyltransferase involved in cell wall biosynthesis
VVADRNPHKRLGLLLDAWRLLGHDRPRLRVIGAAGRPPADVGVSFENGLSAAEVAAAMRSAELVALPSTAESFGLPALEALACETPLLVSDIPAFREVTAGHAAYVDSDRAEEWAAALRATLATPSAPGPGRAWALRFTWERCAAATAEVLLEAHRLHI